VASYSEEAVDLNLAFAPHPQAISGMRLTYPRPTDNDWQFGVLWARQDTHRRGQPQFDQMNTPRQVECMLGGLCQVCREPAACAGRLWWLFPHPAHSGSPRVSKPPTCRACIPAAINACPRLRNESYVYTSGPYNAYGVLGHLLAPTKIGPQMCARHDGRTAWELPFGPSRAIEWTLARALIVQVQDLRREETPA
jgi:hypothetical protein